VVVSNRATTGAGGQLLARLTAVTAAAIFLLIVAGGVVRVTGSGLGCGAPAPGEPGQNWPLCNGHLVPPPDIPTLIEFSHRVLALIATVLMVATLVVVWARHRSERRLVVAATAATVLLVIQIVLGFVVVETGLLGSTILVHLANAELLLGVLVYLAYAARVRGTSRDRRELAPAGLRQLLWGAAVAVYILLLSGAVVVDTGSSSGCLGWPLCGNGFQLASTAAGAINLLHRGLVLVVALFVGFAMGMALRRTSDRGVRLAAMTVNLLLLAQVAAGAVMVDTDFATAARSSHEALASAFWAMTLLVAVLGHRTALRVRTVEPPPRIEERRAAAAPGVSGG
jgi:heme A synthase